HTVLQPDRPEIRGMLRKVSHLVIFEEISAAEADAFRAEAQARRTPKAVPTGPRAKDVARAAWKDALAEKAAKAARSAKAAPAAGADEDGVTASAEPVAEKAPAKKAAAKKTAAKKAPAKKAAAKKAPAEQKTAKKTAAKKTAAKKAPAKKAPAKKSTTKKSEG
ncbi:MAG: 50S ribosomal protein L30, partial [Actinomycetota bacterium]|nr:50S ribosomal protein L30 [Actinomycetota bacterium]